MTWIAADLTGILAALEDPFDGDDNEKKKRLRTIAGLTEIGEV
jgi:hypothetical protein